MRKHIWKVLLILVLVLGAVGYVRYFWVFGTGVKAGELNYLVHKGVLFKTYEGKMIQTGIRSQNGTLESFEFMFSVEDPEVAQELMVNSGNQFNLHYREYLASLPWRGHSKFVVDSIVSMKQVSR
jgi:flagellar basal body-associated protein FliL